MEGSPHETILELFRQGGTDTGERVADALAIGTEYLDMETGFFARRDDDTHDIVQSVSDHDQIQPGHTYPIESVHYDEMLGANGTSGVEGGSTSESAHTDGLERLGFESSLCAKVMVNGDVDGFVCFAETTARSDDFSTVEETFVSLLAKLTGQSLERNEYRREIATQIETDEHRGERPETVAEGDFEVLFRLDAENRLTVVSPAIRSVLGYERDELIGSAFDEFVVSPSSEAALEPFTHGGSGTQRSSETIELVDRYGDITVVDIVGEPIIRHGRPVGIYGTLRDVTAQRGPEQELLIKSQAMNEADIGICIADNQRTDTPLVYVNEGFERLTGYGANEAVGENCRFLQGEATDPESVATLRKHIEDGQPTSVTLVNYRKNGAPFWNHVQLTPITSGAGEVAHFVGFQADVTTQKRNEQLLAVLNRVLRHNLRNDMNLIQGYSDLIQEAINHDDAALARKIEEAARKLVELSDQALELERDARESRVLKRLNTAELLSDVVDDVTAHHPTVTVDLTIDTERNICAGAELDDALRELVENAIKHSDAQKPWVGIDVGTEGECVTITVEDNGPGVSSMESNAISHGTETALSHGSGLGLWLVNWIVTRYGGSFQIHAKDGDSNGTVARVQLPGIGSEQSIEEVARRPTALFL